MDRDAIRAFAHRDRTEVATAKADWWAHSDRDVAIAAAHALWTYTRSTRPEDREHHLRLKALLDRAGRGFSRR